jgi:predicted DNA-binding protein
VTSRIKIFPCHHEDVFSGAVSYSLDDGIDDRIPVVVPTRDRSKALRLKEAVDEHLDEVHDKEPDKVV